MAVTTFSDCCSDLERNNRSSAYLVSILFLLLGALLVVGSMGVLLILIALGWAVDYLLADYNQRMLRALGAKVTRQQFSEVHAAYEEVRQRFNVAEDIPIVVIEAASVNALAVRFARRKMIVVFSEMLVSVQDSPAQLRFFLAHEMCHCVLDHGWRRFIELYKPPKFKRGRELTCDNAGLVAAGSVAEAHAALAKLAVGRHLWGKLKLKDTVEEAREIMSGLIGWFVGRNLIHPAVGDRLSNASDFARTQGIA
jgi:Zn-dependent protease with chaperone function